jgi:hypothetical protein
MLFFLGKKNKPALLLMGLLLATSGLLAQKDSVKTAPKLPAAFLVNLSYGVHFPGGDLGQRFGTLNAVGGSVQFLSKNNWLVGADVLYGFGDLVKENVLSMLETPQGLMIDQNGQLAIVIPSARSVYVGGRLGYLIPLLKNGTRTGIELGAGAGYYRHWLRIEDQSETLVQLQGDYRKGYDRLTDGTALYEYVGFRFSSRRRLINFFAGAEFGQGFTRNRRVWNYNEVAAETNGRLDLFFGLRFGWTIPLELYSKETERRYYY